MGMEQVVSNGILVRVENYYRGDFSKPKFHHFMFSYRIHIQNTTDEPVQLLRRHWHIFDSITGPSEVEGAGVVGEQPVLEPGQAYTYESACNLHSELGRMRGTYLFKRLGDGALFEVKIPTFHLVAPLKLN